MVEVDLNSDCGHLRQTVCCDEVRVHTIFGLKTDPGPQSQTDHLRLSTGESQA